MLLNTYDKTRKKYMPSVVITFLPTIIEELMISGENNMIDNTDWPKRNYFFK